MNICAVEKTIVIMHLRPIDDCRVNVIVMSSKILECDWFLPEVDN